MVDQKKFDELVASTTHYLQDLLNRVTALEAKVEDLSKPKGKKDAE